MQKIADLVSGHCKPDVIKLDINMPGLDADAVLDRIRNDPQLRLIATHFERQRVS